MSGTLIFGHKTNKDGSTLSKLCTCEFLDLPHHLLKFQNVPISIVDFSLSRQ